MNTGIFTFSPSSPVPVGQFLTQLTKSPWVKGIQDFSNTRSHLFPRRDKSQLVKTHYHCPEQFGQFHINLAQGILGLRGYGTPCNIYSDERILNSKYDHGFLKFVQGDLERSL